MDSLVIAALVLMIGLLTAWTLPHLVCPWREQVTLRRLAERIGLHYHGRRTLGVPRSGRAAGVCYDRECTIETFKQMGVDPCTRVVVAVDNPMGCSFDVVQRPSSSATGEAAPCQVVTSAPEDLARTVLDACDVEGRTPQFPRQVRANGYHLSLKGHTLRLEHRPRWLCFGPVEQDIAGYRALLQTLCDTAEAIEAVEVAQPRRAVAPARGR
jgi:hypothetical protein